MPPKLVEAALLVRVITDNLVAPKSQIAIAAIFVCRGQILKKREGVPEMGTKPLKALRGYRASNRGSKKL